MERTERARSGPAHERCPVWSGRRFPNELINLNIISKEKILEAHQGPSKYPDLVVRVTGYSAYFHSLSPEYRQQVVDRILAD